MLLSKHMGGRNGPLGLQFVTPTLEGRIVSFLQ